MICERRGGSHGSMHLQGILVTLPKLLNEREACFFWGGTSEGVDDNHSGRACCVFFGLFTTYCRRQSSRQFCLRKFVIAERPCSGSKGLGF